MLENATEAGIALFDGAKALGKAKELARHADFVKTLPAGSKSAKMLSAMQRSVVGEQAGALAAAIVSHSGGDEEGGGEKPTGKPAAGTGPTKGGGGGTRPSGPTIGPCTGSRCLGTP
jgi:hypothetical protein